MSINISKKNSPATTAGELAMMNEQQTRAKALNNIVPLFYFNASKNPKKILTIINIYLYLFGGYFILYLL
tara:strand:- start:980 stop:1189 length:210 start_codon:yes stop_codon:yes gene_type:complete